MAEAFGFIVEQVPLGQHSGHFPEYRLQAPEQAIRFRLGVCTTGMADIRWRCRRRAQRQEEAAP